MLAITSGGSVRSPVKGLPGARRIIKKEIVIRINNVGIASRQRRRINFNIARTFWRVPDECYKIDTVGQARSPHVLPLMLDNIKILNGNIIQRVFTGITPYPWFHQAGVNVVVNRNDRRVFIELLF
ncbi:Uncharacterised protein [Enterobacter cloacae]|nr:Uncharacterised protein [Enterobacter cloacae]